MTNLKKRWVHARPGSVLILVIALLVLLALIGTAYLSSTQTERYSSVQNTINTEADLLIDGLRTAVSSQITAGIFGGSTYRPAQQEQPSYPTAGVPVYPSRNGYYNYTSATIDPALTPNDPNPSDLILADRIPIYSNNTNGPVWNSISWPLFTDSSGNYTFDSPFGSSISTYTAVNKGKMQIVPGFKSANGQLYPAISFYVNSQLTDSSGNNANLTSTGPIIAASASGDGIADAGLCKLPIGPIDGITYYYATRVIDGNSAINASSANSQGPDSNVAAGMSTTNYGFFRANIGLQELLFNVAELSGLNSYRFAPYSPTPVSDAGFFNPPTNFTWYSYADEIENQLIRRPGNPGSGPSKQFDWMGQKATAALAYKFSLVNPNTNPSSDPTALEYWLPYELVKTPTNISYRSSPYSPAEVGTWWNNNFAGFTNYNGTNSSMPLRTLLVGNNSVSNAIPARLGNAGSSSPVGWTANTVYKFGDWVVDGPPGAQRSFVCIQQHTALASNEPEPGPYNAGVTSYYNAGALPYWAGAEAPAPATYVQAPGVPWSSVPIKTSVNTATFEQLWLAFAQVMTDSISINNTPTGDAPVVSGAVAQWQPPMQPVAASLGQEQQMGPFRSILRDAKAPGAGKTILSSAQMLKLRAALAAVNTLDLRDADDDVSSREIVLTDDTGAPQYDVEVYGTEKQPYISEVIIQTDGKAADNYVALEICNPYPQAITLTNWQIGSMNRASFPAMTMTAGLAIPVGTQVPAASAAGVPGLLILEDNLTNRPADLIPIINANLLANGTTSQLVALPGLAQAALGITNLPNEIFLMRPRLATGTQSKAIAGNDIYDESNPAANVADYVPVDQLDLTGLTIPASAGGPNPPAGPTPATRYYYRRGDDATAANAWHFVYPGFYDPTSINPAGRYFTVVGAGAPAAIQSVVVDPANPPLNTCYLGAPTGGVNAVATYNTLPIELNNTHMAGPNPVQGTNNLYPYGAFARNVDMLQIPFIGAYRIRPYTEKGTQSQIITELNSVSMDSALAFDNSASPNNIGGQVAPDGANTTLNNTFNEQIGRFCPIGDPSQTNNPQAMLDYGPGYATGDTTEKKVYWHYHWAKRLFDYLTVQAPGDDYYPNVDPAQTDSNASPPIAQKYPIGVPDPVSNTNPSYANAQTGGHSEDTTGAEGLININTAPVPVLAQLPFYGTSLSAPSAQQQSNATLAGQIVAYRNQHGPFQSIMDLYRVPEFLAANNAMLTSPAGPTQGEFSPGGIGVTAAATPITGNVRYDFQDRFLLLNNISNLITTRSDTFTCYVLLQGWRNVGTGNPTLVVQRRTAFLLDRNNVTPSNNQPDTLKIPSD